MKNAMSKIQDRGFDVNKLDNYEAVLWREREYSEISSFEDYLNMDGRSMEDLQPFQSRLRIDKSGIEDDPKRFTDQALDCWQTGFSTTEKRLESLKRGGKFTCLAS